MNFDSDEEADFSKMDMGNKKGPINRWDFDTNEEYGNYMSNKEALPKYFFKLNNKKNIVFFLLKSCIPVWSKNE